MYKIYCDDNLIYKSNTSNDGNSELSYSILSGRLQQSLNQSGSLRFTVGKNCIWDTNSYIPMKSIFELYQDDDLIFRGRAFAPKADLYKRVTIDCEGDFAFFNDTYQEPFEFFGTVRDFLAQIISFHNTQVEDSKKFILGRVTVIPDNETGKIVRSSDSYMNTMQMLHNKLFNTELGGYMWVRHEQSGTYLDYLADMGDVNEQAVVQSINLMSAEKELTAESFATVIVPIGAMIEPEEGQEEEIPEYVTIKSVNGGKMYIEDTEAVRRYGRIVKLVEHDGITEPLNLLREATKDLEKATSMTVTTVLTAVDLSSAGYEISPFSFGKYVDVSVKNLGVVDRFLISEITLDLLAPENNTIRIGQKRKTITESGLSQEEIANLTTIKLNKSIIKSNQIDALVHSVTEDLNTFTETVTAEIENLQDQIDGQITTWYYAYAPTLNNEPARSWTTDEEKNNHIGDLFYDSSTGYAYRFMLDGSTYKWVRIADEDISEALALAQKAQDTADGKRRVFTTQPVPPYDKGDLWTQGTAGDILTCMTPKATGETYSFNDWQKLNKYTDDTTLTNFIAGDFATLSQQVDLKAETWYQSTDPSTGWSASEKQSHTGDLWYRTTDNTTWRYSGSSWVMQNVPTEVFDRIDGKAQIFITEPTTPYHVGDLWFDSTTSDIMTCINARLTGNFTANDWQKRNRYTEDLDFENSFTWNTQETIATFQGKVYKDEVDVTSNYPDQWFSWWLRNEDNVDEKRIAIGKSCQVSSNDLGYGSTVIGIFTTYDSNLLTTKNGTYLTTKNGTRLFDYTEN